MQSTHLLTWDPRVPTLEDARTQGIFLEFYDPHGHRFGLPTYPFHCAPMCTVTQDDDVGAGLRR